MSKVNKNKNNLLLKNNNVISRSSYFIDPNNNYFDDGGDENNKSIIPDSINDFVKSDNFGSILSSAGTIINSGISNARIGSDSNIKQSINSFTATPVERSSREALSNQWVNTIPLKNDYNSSDFTPSTGERFGNTLGATLSGISSGSKVGGVLGGAIGGVIGLGTSIGGMLIGNRRARAQAKKLNKLATEANEDKLDNYYASADFLDELDMFNYLSNYKSMGGQLNNLFERGGYLSHSHGSIFDNDVIHINEGGTHEDNPYGGVQSGVDSEGQPNLVEEGEVIYNDYVFSNRLYATGGQLEEYNLPKKYDNWTFAKIANELSKESEERTNDPISMNGLDDSMNKLRSLQESLRSNEQQSNIFDEGGDLEKKARKYANRKSGASEGSIRWNEVYKSKLAELTEQENQRKAADNRRRQAEQYLIDLGYNYNDAYREEPYTRFNAGLMPSVARVDRFDFKKIDPDDLQVYYDILNGGTTYEGLSDNDNLIGPPRPSKNNEDVKANPIDNAESQPTTASNTSGISNNVPQNKTPTTQQKTRDFGPTISQVSQKARDVLMPLLSGRAILAQEELADQYQDYLDKIDDRGLLPSETKRPSDNGSPLQDYFDTAGRYAPLLGNLLAYLGNSKDYSDVDAYMEQTANPRSVVFTPIGNYIRPDYVSPWELTNPIEREAASTRRYLMNNAGNNRAAANAALVASDNNTLGLLGQALLQGKQYNQQQRLTAEDFNRGTNQFNSQGSLQAQSANMNLNNYYLNRALNNYNFRFGIDTMYDQARSQNITSLFNNLANIGRENYIMNQINSNRGLYYGADRRGRSSYKNV